MPPKVLSVVESRETHVISVGEQGPPGPMGPSGPPGSTEAPALSALNTSGLDMPRCTPVGMNVSGTLVQADGVTNVHAIGLVQQAVLWHGAYGLVQTGGELVASVAEWEAVVGEVGGLIPGARYFLSATAGQLTRAPAGVSAVAPVGRASSTTRMSVDIEPLIYL